MYHKWKSWCIVLEIWSATDIIFSHSGPSFCPFTSLKTPKIKILKKWKKCLEISQKCTFNDNHMMYDSWDMKHNRQNFLSFWAIFCFFTPLTTQKSIFWKNQKNIWRYHHFTITNQKSWSYAILFLRYATWRR